MMRPLKNFVKQWLIPGTVQALVLCLLVGVVLLNLADITSRIGRYWLTTVALVYWILSLPVVAAWLIGRLGRPYDAVQQPLPRCNSALIVIGNGSVHYSDGRLSVDYLTRRSVFCVMEAVRLYGLTHPAIVVATGGAAGNPRAVPESYQMRDMMVRFGVPGDRIVVDPASVTTEQQVRNVLDLLRVHGATSVPVVVTTSAHMKRVVALFAQHGASIVPSITPELRYDDIRGWRRWWPSNAALIGSASAIYEIMAGALAFADRVTGSRRR